MMRGFAAGRVAVVGSMGARRAAVVGGALLLAGAANAGNWPQFRGPGAAGIGEGPAVPTRWDVEKGENIRWKTAIPGLGLSSPIVWGDRIFLTTAIGNEADSGLKTGLYGDIESANDVGPQKWVVMCLSTRTGDVIWQQTAYEGVPKIKRHTKASHANSTAATDGKHVVAFFGSEGMYCYDVGGKLLWKKDFGVLDSGFFMAPEAQWGFGSSPIIHDGKVIIQVDVQKDSFVAALDVNDGNEIWRTKRDDVPTWGSPAIVKVGDETHVVCNGYKHAGAYNLAGGAEVWKLKGGGDIPTPTPVIAHDLIFITNAHGMQRPIYAIRTSAKGDITPPGTDPTEHIAWFNRQAGNYMQTPLVIGDELYMCFDNGVLTVHDAKSGKKHYKERLGKGSTGFTPSGVASGDHVFFTAENGDVTVIRRGTTFEQVAKNSMGADCMATPAIADGTLYVRTTKELVAIGAK
ncbi:MAG: PQQ-binding-like beta-propeller repeat protein [Phycisphaerae bacterium]|nr:PQQ-binding-like beta-propeller repeat protein [Phycisphaerae bacterium]